MDTDNGVEVVWNEVSEHREVRSGQVRGSPAPIDLFAPRWKHKYLSAHFGLSGWFLNMTIWWKDWMLKVPAFHIR